MTEVTTTKVVWYKRPWLIKASRIVGGVLLFVLAVWLVVAFIIPWVPSRIAAAARKPVERLAQPTEREVETMRDRPVIATVPTQQDLRLVDAMAERDQYKSLADQLVKTNEKNADTVSRLTSINVELARSVIASSSKASVDSDRERLAAAERAKEAEEIDRLKRQVADLEKKRVQSAPPRAELERIQALERELAQAKSAMATAYQAATQPLDSTPSNPAPAPAASKPSRPRPEPSAYDHVVPPGAASKMFTPDDFMTKRIVPFGDNVDVTVFYKGGIINKQQSTYPLPRPEQGMEGEGFKLDDYEGVHGVRFRSRDKGVPLRISQNPR